MKLVCCFLGILKIFSWPIVASGLLGLFLSYFFGSSDFFRNGAAYILVFGIIFVALRLPIDMYEGLKKEGKV